ncbi:MAG: hypothetical protein U0325_26790 [Polyangiales bacterium]
MRAALSMLVILSATWTARAQGTVQMHDPRRPPPLSRTERCEVWAGTVSGNDPTAQASMQICAEGGARVRGVFLWSSLQSGWDRRAFEGEWSPDGQGLTLRDTHMIESHPMNGWMLCTADRYDLRRVVPTRLEGSYLSAGCSDRGTLSLSLQGEGEMATTPTPAPPPVGATPPPVRRASGCGCTVPAAPPRYGALAMLAMMGIGLRFSRRVARRP